jgi:predicted secreted acid phosphatase
LKGWNPGDEYYYADEVMGKVGIYKGHLRKGHEKAACDVIFEIDETFVDTFSLRADDISPCESLNPEDEFFDIDDTEGHHKIIRLLFQYGGNK